MLHIPFLEGLHVCFTTTKHESFLRTAAAQGGSSLMPYWSRMLACVSQQSSASRTISRWKPHWGEDGCRFWDLHSLEIPRWRAFLGSCIHIWTESSELSFGKFYKSTNRQARATRATSMRWGPGVLVDTQNAGKMPVLRTHQQTS